MIEYFVVALLVLPFAGAATSTKKDGIYYLVQDDFDDILGEKTFAVFFNSPWSDISSQVLYEFQKAAKILLAENAGVSFGVVDLSQDEYTAFRFGVDGGPQIRMFHAAKPYFYEGNNTGVGMVDTMRKHGRSDWTPPERPNKVIELKDIPEFEAHIKKEKLTLIDFYAPWCNHCKQLEPVLTEVAEALAQLDPPVTVAKIDVQEHHTLFDRFEMKGYPYLMVFKNGQHTNFEKAKNPANIIEFVKERMSVISTALPAVSGAALSFSDSKKTPAVVGYFTSRSAFEYQQFVEVAERMREDKGISFGHVIGSKALEVAARDFGLTSEDYGVVVVRDRRLPTRDGEKRFALFEEDPMQKDVLKTFIADNRRSLVGYANEEIFHHLYRHLSPVVLVFMDIDWDPETASTMNYRLNQVAKVARNYPDMHFVAMDHSEMHKLRSHVGLGENDNDMTAAVLVNATFRYPLDGESSVDTLPAHLDSFNAGQLSPYFRSQKVPASNDGAVKTLVRSTYDQVMSDTTVDIAVLFMTPWSQESLKFLPVFRKAHAVLNSESVVFYKYDCVVNDVPEGVSTEKYPTLLLFKAGEDRQGEPEKYTGPRNSKSIAAFFTEEAATLNPQSEEAEQEVGAEEQDVGDNNEGADESHDEL